MTDADGGHAPDHLGPLHHLVDLFVCAPLGFVLDAPSLLPRWIDRGREQLASLGDVGRVVSGRGSGEGASRAGKQAHATLRGLGLAPEPDAGDRGDVAQPAAGSAPTSAPRPAPPVAAVPPLVGPDVDTLAITDYDSLSASQVVPRLDGLAPDELESIRAYETANRGRKTILSKIAQLQAS